MKTLILFWMIMTCAACSGRPAEAPAATREAAAMDGGPREDDGAPPDAAQNGPSMLDERLEFVLKTHVPAEIPQLGLKVTLLEAFQTVGRGSGGRWSHGDRLLIRFERAGEAPLDVRFGSGQRVHTLFGHEFAVWGGTQLSVYPPGMPADP